MSAQVIHFDFKAHRARTLALAKAETVRELAEDFARFTEEGRALMATYYLQKGWANQTDVKLALEALEGVP